jgi:hypothetical protein
MVNPRRFPDSELVEHNPKFDVDALYRAGALFTGQISRWACHWLTVTIRAAWERIWIADRAQASIARLEQAEASQGHACLQAGCGGELARLRC